MNKEKNTSGDAWAIMLVFLFLVGYAWGDAAF